MSPPQSAAEARMALLAGVGCYTFWGFVPLVFQAIARTGAGSWEIVGHRTFWAVFWAGGLVLFAGHQDELRRVLRSPGTLALLALSAALISVNWSLYVWAVNNGRTLEASLGYYVIPLINMAAGTFLFRERLDRFALAAIVLACLGVALQALALGRLPWISLVLALSFGGYGMVRKQVKAEAQVGLFVECLFMTVPGGLFIAWLQLHGQGHFLASAPATVWLFLAGPVTVLPLVLFSWAARRMPLSSMGFLQFLGPTITFVIGVVEGEAFGWLRAVSFLFIWGGAGVFGWGAWRAAQRARLAMGPVAPASAEACVSGSPAVGVSPLS